jgi:hypothetical protein
MTLALALEESRSLLYGRIARRRFSRILDDPRPPRWWSAPVSGEELTMGADVKMKYPGGEVLAAAVVEVLKGVGGAPTGFAKVKLIEHGHRLEGRTTGWIKADTQLLVSRSLV